jgi:1,4-alpha-glucan branching enzyme
MLPMIIKTYVASDRGTTAQVSFELPESLWATTVHLVGDFNAWDHKSHQFERDRDGKWTITVQLETGRVYQFRYLLDNCQWMNDGMADGYVTNHYGSDNGLVITDPDFQPHIES